MCGLKGLTNKVKGGQKVLLEKVITGVGRLTGTDRWMGRITEQPHYQIGRGIVGWHIEEIPPELVKAAYCGICGVVEGIAMGILWAEYSQASEHYSPGDITPVMLLVGASFVGAMTLGTASAVKSLRKSLGVLADHPLRHVVDGAASGAAIGFGVIANTEPEFLSSELTFTAQLVAAGAVVGAGVSFVELTAIKTFNYVCSRLGF